MKAWIGLLLPVVIGAAQASAETAKVYIFQEPKLSTTSTTSTLTLEETRLIIAQRFGSSQYNVLNDASKDTLEYISAFGGEPSPLFADDNQDKERSHLVLMIGGKNDEASVKKLQERWGKVKPDFEISNPTSVATKTQLIQDFGPPDSVKAAGGHRRRPIIDEVNPFSKECWSGRSKMMYLNGQVNPQDISDLLDATNSIMENVASEALDVMVIVLPESSGDSASSYSTYDMHVQDLKARQIEDEEPIEMDTPTAHFYTSNASSPNNYTRTPPGTFASCYSTQDSCVAATMNCSGHGTCYAKIKSNSSSESCYTCQCMPSVNITHTENGEKKVVTITTYWGGNACQKIDVSSQFWLLVVVAVVLASVVSAAIGMMFGIGEEKLPGVIGAGVLGPKAR